MDILKKANEILATFGNIRAMEKLHVDTYTEEKIKNVSGIKIAESKDVQIWVNFQELNGFLFMNATILSNLNLKTANGAKIVFFTNDYEIEIDSDEKEIESDFSNVSNTWITKLSFIIEMKERDLIEKKDFEEIEYQFKKGNLKLSVIK